MPNLNYNVPQKKESNPLEIQILNMIKKDNKISTEKMAMALGISSKTVKRHIKDIGIVRFVGRGSNGHWEIIDDQKHNLISYLSTRIGVKPNTKANYNFVKNLMKKEDFYYKKIGDVKTSDAKLFLIKLQQDGKRYSTVKTVRGVLRPVFQMAVDDDVLYKNPFGFELAGVVVNDSVTREALTRDQML